MANQPVATAFEDQPWDHHLDPGGWRPGWAGVGEPCLRIMGQT